MYKERGLELNREGASYFVRDNENSIWEAWWDSLSVT
jgi:hypothetical protein